MRAAHFLDRRLNLPPLLGLLLVALTFAKCGPLRRFQFSLVAMGADKTPRIIVDRNGFHRGLLLADQHVLSRSSPLLAAMSQIKAAPSAKVPASGLHAAKSS